MDPHYYTVDVNWENGRQGMMSAHGLPQTIAVATPPQFPSGVPGIWSPEHLFIAAVSSCLMTTFLAIAENSKLEFKSLKIGSMGKLENIDGKFMMTEVVLEPELVIIHEKDMERAERVLQKSEAACLISNSIKAKVIMKPSIQVANVLVS